MHPSRLSSRPLPDPFALAALVALSALLPLNAFSQSSWTPPPTASLPDLIAKDPGAAATAIRKSWGEKGLIAGRNKHIEQTTVLWAVQSDEEVLVVKGDGSTLGQLTKLDDKGLRALAIDLGNHTLLDFTVRTASGTSLNRGSIKIEYYDYTPDSVEQAGVPQGRLTRHNWAQSSIFPNTEREYMVYLPAKLDKSTPLALMVFQDGLRHADRNANGGLRAPVVFDNLIAAGAMPPTLGIFINPGRKAGQDTKAKPGNRSVEYDSLGDAYVRFLLDEIIPQVVSEHGITLSDKPSHWAIAGGSSGCACAWTAAWERPDKFGKVLGWVGTFVDIRGAHNYPPLVRKNDAKPIRAALLGEHNDLDNQFGNWPLANQQMEKALAYKEYDYRYWWGDGFHGSRHAAHMLPEMMRWLWSE